jgi:phosphatidylinositol glycan class V
LTKTIFGAETNARRAFCLVSAALHIISPAGAFLSAPYGESVFSFLNLTAFHLYLSALFDEDIGRHSVRDVKFLAAAVLFALATTVRSNGILSGCLFAYDAILGVSQAFTRSFSFGVVRRLFVVVFGGSIIALGMIGPQYVAFMTYCTDPGLSRPWCEQLIPSIYGWVQMHYW